MIFFVIDISETLMTSYIYMYIYGRKQWKRVDQYGEKKKLSKSDKTITKGHPYKVLVFINHHQLKVLMLFH